MKYLANFTLMDEDKKANAVHEFVNTHDEDEYFPLGFFLRVSGSWILKR